jgi:cell wall-associated NlpC family hydrolase
VIIMSGAMAASLALPASATAPAARAKRATATATAAASTEATTQVVLGVAAAPSAAQAPLAPQAFGHIRFSGVDKSKHVPVRTATGPVSRSATRIALPQPVSATPVALPPPVPAPRSAGVLGIAASLAGIYYIYGGTTTDGFDCSGYTQYVFAQVGISLPRTAEEQRQATTPVTDPQPGDLVFFGAPAHHVGIYAGDGMMWDSEQSGTAVALRTDRSERNGGATYGRV